MRAHLAKYPYVLIYHENFFSKYDQIRSLLWIWSHLLKKSLMENFIFCAVSVTADKVF